MIDGYRFYLVGLMEELVNELKEERKRIEDYMKAYETGFTELLQIVNKLKKIEKKLDNLSIAVISYDKVNMLE